MYTHMRRMYVHVCTLTCASPKERWVWPCQSSLWACATPQEHTCGVDSAIFVLYRCSTQHSTSPAVQCPLATYNNITVLLSVCTIYVLYVCCARVDIYPLAIWRCSLPSHRVLPQWSWWCLFKFYGRLFIFVFGDLYQRYVQFVLLSQWFRLCIQIHRSYVYWLYLLPFYIVFKLHFHHLGVNSLSIYYCCTCI